ncbi:MAG TPA: hypothetical protein VH500_17030 [Nitrososphaeraceae archaeon]
MSSSLNPTFVHGQRSGTLSLDRLPIPTLESSLLPSTIAAPVAAPLSTTGTFATSTTADDPETFINFATDGNGNNIPNGGSTTSTKISFNVRGVPNPLTLIPVVSFQCSLDGAAFVNCGSSGSSAGTIIYNQLVSGRTHTVEVAAVDQNGNIDQSPPSFSWTITSTGAIFPQINNTSSADDVAAAQAFTNAATNIRNAKEAEQAAATDAISVNNAAILNPPFKPCVSGDDLAIYNIYGDANLRNLIRNTATLAPISILIYVDTIPDDVLNLIINNNSVYLKGVLVAYPGDTTKQASTDFRITKILTECKKTNLIDKAEDLGGPSKGTFKPSVVKPGGNNPPFENCATTAGSLSPPLPASGTRTVGSTSPVTFPQRKAISEFSNNGTNLSPIERSLTVAATAPTVGTGPVGTFQSGTTSGVAGATTPPANSAGGVAPDLAQYIIRGTIDSTRIKDVNGKQNIVIKLFNDPFAGKLGSQQTVRIFDSNNQFAATFQVNPSEDAHWIPLNFVLHELSTVCGQAAFVDRPMEIGTDPADYSTQPRMAGKNS